MRDTCSIRLCLLALVCGLPVGLSGCMPTVARLSREEYLDRCRGAWAGQMIAVCYGEPYQFQSNGKPILGGLRPWTPDRIANAVNQDDVYVELTFLAALERHGINITPAQAGAAFAATDYPLWHANYYGRANIRAGILPPLSGHPMYNRHCDDIDFQIEADLFGILCPTMPRTSNDLCDVFGHIMNYGDGVYAGMFVAGMYTAAWFEPRDVLKVVRAGLACIPPQSQCYQCLADTVGWCRQYPDDWLTTWRLLEEKWNDDLDCIPGNPHNIDAKLNAAYAVIGLLYGGGDYLKTIEICTRCGQDADSSTANAGGVVGCMLGYEALSRQVQTGIETVADQKFRGSDYTFNSLPAACQRITEQIIARNGGKVLGDAYLIAVQSPRPPDTLEQWTGEREAIHLPVTDHEVALWNREWKQVPAESEFAGGYYPAEYGRTNVLMLGPITPSRPAAIATDMIVPDTPQPRLEIEVASDGQHGDYLLKIHVNDRLVSQKVINTDGTMVWETVDLGAPPNSRITVRLEFHANDWSVETAYVRTVRIR